MTLTGVEGVCATWHVIPLALILRSCEAVSRSMHVAGWGGLALRTSAHHRKYWSNRAKLAFNSAVLYLGGLTKVGGVLLSGGQSLYEIQQCA